MTTIEKLNVDAARDVTDRLILTLTDAHELLIEAFVGKAHEALGYGTGAKGWRAYCAAEFGELLHVRLNRESAQAMQRAGMSVRAIGAPFGLSPAATHAYVTDAPAKAAPVGTKMEQALALLAVNPAGLTVHAVARKVKWHHGSASATLTRAARSGRCVYVPPAKRGQTGVYRPVSA
jgi:hypothetical protein